MSEQLPNITVTEIFTPLEEINISLPMQTGTFKFVSLASNTIILSYQFQHDTGAQYL